MTFGELREVYSAEKLVHICNKNGYPIKHENRALTYVPMGKVPKFLDKAIVTSINLCDEGEALRVFVEAEHGID